jgi:transaldolase
MPMSTLQAFWDHGVVANAVGEDVAEAEQLFRQLARLGIDIDEVTDVLEREGVEKFASSYDSLLETIQQHTKAAAPA